MSWICAGEYDSTSRCSPTASPRRAASPSPMVTSSGAAGSNRAAGHQPVPIDHVAEPAIGRRADRLEVGRVRDDQSVGGEVRHRGHPGCARQLLELLRRRRRGQLDVGRAAVLLEPVERGARAPGPGRHGQRHGPDDPDEHGHDEHPPPPPSEITPGHDPDGAHAAAPRARPAPTGWRRPDRRRGRRWKAVEPRRADRISRIATAIRLSPPEADKGVRITEPGRGTHPLTAALAASSRAQLGHERVEVVAEQVPRGIGHRQVAGDHPIDVAGQVGTARASEYVGRPGRYCAALPR